MNMVALTMMVMLVISFTTVTTAGGFRRVKCLEDASETRVPLSTGGDTITITITVIISIIVIVIIIIITTIFIFTMIAVSQNGGQ